MSKEKVVPITDAKSIADEKSLKEEMFTQSVRNYILEECSNSPSLGHGDKLDTLAGELEIKLFDGILDACIANPNFDAEIFFDSFSDDLLVLFKKFHDKYGKLQHLKLLLEESE